MAEEVNAIINGRAGYFAGTVRGESMRGYYNDGDTVIIKGINFESIKVGQIVVYSNDFGDVVIHRVEEKIGRNFKMCGSNNKGCDSTILTEFNVIGIAYGVIHGRGTFRELSACAQK